MAVTWGAQVTGTSGRKFQVGWEVVVTAQDDDSVDARLDVWFKGTYGIDDAVNDLEVGGGAWSHDGDIDNDVDVTYNTPLLIWSQTVTFTKNYGATQAKNLTIALRGLDVYGTGTTATVSATPAYTVPARAYALAAAPTSVAAARVSDTQHTITWTNTDPGSASAPYQSIRVQRRVDGGAWATIANNIPVAETFTDSTTTADHLYEYQVAGVNTTGVGAYGVSSGIQTSPLPPIDATAVKDASNNIVITWDNTTALTAYSTEIEHSSDGGANWSALATKSAGVETHTHNSPSLATSHKYRVRAKSTVGATTYSTYAVSATVTLAAPPDAPQSLAPNGVATDATEDQVLSWVHMPTDASPQSKFQVRHRVVGAGSWTTESEVTSATSEWQLNDGTYTNGQNIEWQVKTWGAHATGSAWSASATVQMRTRPTATISSPSDAEELGTSTATVAWSYYQAQSQVQTAWRATLLDGDGEPLEVKTGPGTGGSVTFATALLDGGEYSLRVELQAASGLWSLPDEIDVTVSYLPPADVALALAYDEESGAMVITLVADAATEDETVDAAAVTVERSIDNGAWEVVNGQEVTATGVLIDALPTINGSNRYRAVVRSTLPSIAVMDPVELVTTERRRHFLNGGPGFGQVVAFWGNPKVSTRDGRKKVLRAFEGRRLPMQLTGQLVVAETAFSGLLSPDASTPDEVRDLAHVDTIVAFRDPTPRRLFGSLSDVSVVEREELATMHSLGFSITETARA